MNSASVSRRTICISIFSLFFLFSFSQKIFYSDTVMIRRNKDTIVRSECNCFFNFLKLSRDSVITINSQTYTLNKVRIEVPFRNKNMNGPVKFYVNDSLLFMQGFLKNGKPDSTFTCYQISNANYKKELYTVNFRNGLKNGEENEFCDKGTVIYVRTYKDGKLDGVYRHFDDYGNKLTEGVYKMEKKEGVWLEADPPVRVYVFQNYKNGEMTDYLWTSNYPNGKLFMQGTYDKKGKKQGVFEVYDEEGNLTRTETYKDGKRNGDFIDFYQGKAVGKTKYKNDMIIRD